MINLAKLAPAVLVGVILLTGCGSADPAPPRIEPTATVTPVQEQAVLKAWGEGQFVDAAFVTVSKPVLVDGGATVDVEVHNQGVEVLRSVELTPVLDSVAADGHVFAGDDPGSDLSVQPGKSATYTAKWSDIDPSAELGAEVRVFYGDRPATYIAYWG